MSCYLHLTGRMTADPEAKKDGAICAFSIANNFTEQHVKKVSYFDVACSGKMAESILGNPSYKKGVRLELRGNLRQRRWKTEAGKSGSSYTLWLDAWPEFLDPKARPEEEGLEPVEFPDVDVSDSIPF